MQYIRGKLAKLDDLQILLDILKEKLGEIRLFMPYRNDLEVSICYDGALFYLNGVENESPRFSLIKFIEEWITTNVQPTFEFFEGEKCGTGQKLTEEEIRALIEDTRFNKVKELPEHFEITKIEIQRVPSFLVAHWKTRKPLSKAELYKYGFTLTEVVKLLDEGSLRIRPYKMVESMPLKLRVFLMAVAAVCFIYLILPLNFIHLNAVKFNEALNWALREKILAEDEKKALPVKGCFNTRFYLHKDRIVNAGIDGQVGTNDDLSMPLPQKGYIPTFTVPVK